MNQKTNDDALLIIQAMRDEIMARVDVLQMYLPEPEPGEGDDYEPHMHNGARDAYLYPDLNRDWLRIGLLDLQRGLLALKAAATGGV